MLRIYLCFFLLLLQFIFISGICPISSKSQCKLTACIQPMSANADMTSCAGDTIDQSYKRMCNCSKTNPQYCIANECQDCILIFEKCTTSSTSLKCCPIENGRSFCNTNTGRCEATRFCDGTTTCPFDDLSGDEIKKVAQIIKNSGRFSNEIVFTAITTQEPKKSLWNSGVAANQRIAYVDIYDLHKQLHSEMLVDLKKLKLIQVTSLPHQLPVETDQEGAAAIQIAKSDRRTKAAYERRGLNFSYAEFIPWSIGLQGPLVNLPGKRLIRIISFYQTPNTKYLFWVPVEGIFITIDSNTNSIIKFEDIQTKPITTSYELLPDFSAKPPLKPLVITQVDGSSIKVKGQEIQWYKWKIRYNYDHVHGLQLFHIRYEVDCEERLIIYKISVSEIITPYGAKDKTWRWRNAFDIGEYGVARRRTPLIIGQDIPENSILFNCTAADESGGEPEYIIGCFAAYEKDVGVLYKHSDGPLGTPDARRGRQMFITSLISTGNYDYAFEYIFTMDGLLHVNVKFTGIILSRGVSKESNDDTCIESCDNLLNPYLIGPIHQHYVNYRIDLDVDGINNYVMEVDITNDPIGPENPDGGAFSAKRKIIKVEGSREYDFEKSRTWQIVNAKSRNKFFTPRSYALRPKDVAFTYLNRGNPFLPQGEFIKHPFWVTAYNDSEQSAAGQFPRTGTPYQGLPEFIKDKESLEDQDIVVWYTVGVTHSTRPEEWPIMNFQSGEFSLVPFNFGSQNSEMPLEDRCP